MWAKVKSALGLVALSLAGCYVAIYLPYAGMARGDDNVRFYTIGVFMAPLLLLIGLGMLASALLDRTPDDAVPVKTFSRPTSIFLAVLLVALVAGLVWFAFVWFPGQAEAFGYRRG